jgi:hypothetical protein
VTRFPGDANSQEGILSDAVNGFMLDAVTVSKSNTTFATGVNGEGKRRGGSFLVVFMLFWYVFSVLRDHVYRFEL